MLVEKAMFQTFKEPCVPGPTKLHSPPVLSPPKARGGALGRPQRVAQPPRGQGLPLQPGLLFLLRRPPQSPDQNMAVGPKWVPQNGTLANGNRD